MNRSDAPKKQPVPFATSGQREDLLPTSPAGDNTASYANGFPPVTMILKAAGGLPPKGQDMNQILFELSSLARWSSSGALNSFDAAFANGIDGYPKGAMVLSDDGNSIYVSTADANRNNPNTGGSGWKGFLSYLGIPDAAYALLRTNNLSDLNNKSTAVTNLGLDTTVQQASVSLDRTKNLSDLNSVPAARATLGILPVGTTSNTVAAGNDSRIIGSLQKSLNLSDIADASAAVTNLGLASTVQQAGVALDRTKNLSDLNSISAARNTLGILPVGTTSNTVAAGNDSRITGAMQKSSNLSDVGDVAASRNNLGLKDGAVTEIATQSEVSAGVVAKIVTAATLSGFFDLGATAVNGSIRIPNRPGGILIAWGAAAAGSDGTFTTAFNNPPFVIPQVASGQGTGAFAPDHVVVQSVTNTGFSTYNQSLARKYIAIGK